MPKVVDHDQRRAEIIGALWEVISERGTEGASLMTVARAAGVSVGRIQHYFASKQDLVQAGCQATLNSSTTRTLKPLMDLELMSICPT